MAGIVTEERENENQKNETVLERINDNVVLTEHSVLNENQKNIEEENRKLKEKLIIIDRERQDLRLILEAKEFHEEEERIQIRKRLEQEWESERRVLYQLREQTNEQLVIMKETNLLANKNGENQNKEIPDTNRSSTSHNMYSYKMKLNNS